ncbi:MAG: cobaltochelatase subunit CobN [Cyanobacteria bacterium J06560_5]
MHRLAATPGGSNITTEGVVFIEQTPAPIVVLTAADTDISALHQALDALPKDFSQVRSVNLLQLQQQLTIDTYAEEVLSHARLIILRILGGRSYWSYGLEVVKALSAETGTALIVIPGDTTPDLDLMGHSTVPLAVVNQLWKYFTEGGVNNLRDGLMYASDRVFNTHYYPSDPQPIPRIGCDDGSLFIGHKSKPSNRSSIAKEDASQLLKKETVKTSFQFSYSPSKNGPDKNGPDENLDKQTLQSAPQNVDSQTSFSVGILFYRAHYLAGNTKAIEALSLALLKKGLQPVPIYVSSLKDVEIQQTLLKICKSTQKKQSKQPIDLLINTTSFAVTPLQSSNSKPSSQKPPSQQSFDLWKALDIPVLQAICSGSPKEQWQTHPQGLSPRDIAMNVALPEVDGRIITRAVSFKAAQKSAKARKSGLQTDVVVYEPERDRIEFVADLAARWIKLKHTPPQARKIALILANYPNRDGRMANGVGLDTPTSCIKILQALQQANYTLSSFPTDGDALMAQLAQGITNDPEGYGLKPVNQTLKAKNYQQFFEALPKTIQQGITERWGSATEEWQRFHQPLTNSELANSKLPNSKLANSGLANSELANSGLADTSELPIPGIQFGNVFVGIQPSRGYDIDPSLNYHAPDLAPTHTYMGFYHWLRHHFQADAIVHVGKHGNLEWLPGKGIALSKNCYPEAAFGPMPHFYPFIVNDPGEGAQAKRRSQAVILDHLTPPMTRAELYGPLQQLESLVDEYYEAQNLDPTRLPVIAGKIIPLLETTQLQQDLNLASITPAAKRPKPLGHQNSDLQTWLPQIDGYLCELKEAQIRDGLHIYGQCPEGNQLRDLIIAIARHPNSQHIGLSRAIAQSWDLTFDPLTADLATSYQGNHPHLQSCRTLGDVVEQIEQQAITLITSLLSTQSPTTPKSPRITAVLTWITHTLLPTLHRTTDETQNLLHGLNGGYIPSGPSGAPTRNRPEVLPTGRNFYSVDIRAMPTESAWDVGRKAAEVLIENYTQENGEYPRTLGLSMWGTAAMRTGGDDMAEALALLGTRPVWDGPSRRVTDFEILPLSLLSRPRVDVTLRISGFFRDAFGNLISLFDQAVKAVSALDEPADQNPLADQAQKDYAYWKKAGLTDQQSLERSRYRVFGSKPGAYGAGLQGLIEAQNWESDADLARAYINWSSYAYAGSAGGQMNGQVEGKSAPEAFNQRLSQMQIVLQNQDNREHDLLDSDDYYQFQGGLTAAVKTRRGEAPATYFGDNAVPENPKVRSLKSEIARVYRSRVVNPKWIAGVMRHGYKGAFEMSATVDYLFAYDATTHCVENHMYEGVANAYVFDADVRKFIEKSNPWALRDMAERLLEANQRGLWEGASEQMVDGLRAIAHEAEGQIEAGLSNQRESP